MRRSLLIRGARQLLTLHGPGSGARRGDALRELGVIEDGSILITDGIVANVGPTRRVENLAEARSAEHIDATGHVVMPGFVDACATIMGVPGRVAAHRHAKSMTYRPGQSLSTEDVTATLNYFRSTPGPTLSFQAGKLLDTFLRHGTTSLEARTGFGMNAAGEMKLIRVLNAVHGKCLNVVPTYTAGHDPGIRSGESPQWLEWIGADVIPRAAERKAVRYVEAACGKDGLSLADGRSLLHAARMSGLPVKVYAAGWPNNDAVSLTAEFDAVSLTNVGVLSPDEGSRLARTNAIATLLPARLPPESTAASAIGRRLVDMGVPVALGTGFVPSTCSTYSMQLAVAMACMRMELSPEEAITAATINAAYACGLAARCGSLEFGKDGDVCILNVSDYREIPLYYGANLVSTVIRRGVPVCRSGSVLCQESSSSV